jgi:hypothetical protein
LISRTKPSASPPIIAFKILKNNATGKKSRTLKQKAGVSPPTGKNNLEKMLGFCQS